MRPSSWTPTVESCAMSTRGRLHQAPRPPKRRASNRGRRAAPQHRLTLARGRSTRIASGAIDLATPAAPRLSPAQYPLASRQPASACERSVWAGRRNRNGPSFRPPGVEALAASSSLHRQWLERGSCRRPVWRGGEAPPPRRVASRFAESGGPLASRATSRATVLGLSASAGPASARRPPSARCVNFMSRASGGPARLAPAAGET
jgi:hypothetical protein